MAIYDLYGCTSDDICGARELLEAVLSVKFDIRESEYKGGEYFQWGQTNGEHFVLKRNVDPVDGEPAEMSFPAYKTLFYLNDTLHSKELQEKFQQEANIFVRLRHEDLD